MQNVNETTSIIKAELEPTLKNINKSVEIVSGIIIKTDAGINKVREIIKKTPLVIFSKLGTLSDSLSKGFWGGLCSAFKIFSKKK